MIHAQMMHTSSPNEIKLVKSQINLVKHAWLTQALMTCKHE
jgi:hypothetical protein